MRHHMMHGHYYSAPVSIFTLLFIIGLIVLVVFLLIRLTRNKKDKTPLDILKARLAKGEIDEAEYERIKATLSND